MLAFKLAFKNLIGAGLRTWLNVFVLSISFVLIIFFNGMIDGWNHQARTDTINWEIGGGQYRQVNYDPYDVFTLEESHALIPETLKDKSSVPVLIEQGTIYPKGRMINVLLKGIPPDQEILELPTHTLQTKEDVIPALLGKRMAEAAKLKKGDFVTLRWRDKNGTYDAVEIKVVEIFNCDVPAVDNGQIWLPLEKLWEMTQLDNEATLIVVATGTENPAEISGWKFNDHAALLKDMDGIIQSKKAGASVMYLILLLIALLAIFDTQILSIFRRQKQIGTYIALGMTRRQVVGLFTVEGGAHSILAALLAALYGVPMFVYMAKNGYTMPAMSDDYGLAIAEKIFPVYSAQLILATTVFIIIAATIVSYLPARKIARLNPTDALKGKVK